MNTFESKQDQNSPGNIQTLFKTMGIHTELRDSNKTLPRVPKTTTIYKKPQYPKTKQKSHKKIQYYMSVQNNKKRKKKSKDSGRETPCKSPTYYFPNDGPFQR